MISQQIRQEQTVKPNRYTVELQLSEPLGPGWFHRKTSDISRSKISMEMSVLNLLYQTWQYNSTANVTWLWHFLKHWKCHASWTFPLPNKWHVVRVPFYSEIWHLHEISMVNNTWHAVTFPILFRNLTFTWHFHSQRHKACCYISYTVQKIDIYIWNLIFTI